MTKRMSLTTPADVRIVDAFLTDCEKLSRSQWEQICEHRAARKRDILRADTEWGSVHIAIVKAVDPVENEKDDRLQDSINDRVIKIATAFPDGPPWRGENVSFRKLVGLALSQSLMVLRIYTEIMKRKEGRAIAKPLTEAFHGYARLPEIPGLEPDTTKPNPVKRTAPKTISRKQRKNG